jgi:hypothetical protein
MKNAMKMVILLMLIAPNFCTAQPTPAEELAGDVVVGVARVVSAVANEAQRRAEETEEQQAPAPAPAPAPTPAPASSGICTISVQSLGSGWLSNRDLRIEAAGAAGSDWITRAVDESGIAQGFYPCAQHSNLRVVEEGLLFNRTLWSPASTEEEARAKGILVTVDVAVEGEFEDALAQNRQLYERMVRRLQSQNDKRINADRPGS